jgi:drug/metabolite transporter (DMT)-like permease
MGERIEVQAWLGAAMVSLSVLLVARQSPPDGTRQRDRARNMQWQGIVFALLAVLCGVSGAAVSRSVLISTDLTAWQSAATRLLGGLLLLLPWLRLRTLFPKPRPKHRRWPRVLLATVLGTNMGIVLQQVVLKQLPLGIGITVLSTAPVMALLVAAPEGDHPRAAGVCASLLAVSGIALAVLA